MNAEKTGKFISELRKEKNMTQKDLADILFVSDKAISRWETGKGFPEIGILEQLAKALDVSMVELFQAERIKDTSSDEIHKFVDEGFLAYKKIFNYQKLRIFISGILISLMIIITLLVHLNSPIYFPDEKVVRIETLDDKIVAIVDKDVFAYELSEVEMDDKMVFMACYTTRWYELFKDKQEKMFVVGNKDDIDLIYYYPNEGSDKLIYSNGKTPSFGVKSLPRLVYNYWLLIGFNLSIISIIAYFITRKKYYSKIIFRLSSFFVSITLSLLLLTIINTDKIYNASYYLSGIILLTLFMTLFINLIYHSFKKKA